MLWLQIFHLRKVITSTLQIRYSEEDSSTAPWSFFLSIASFYSLIKGEKFAKDTVMAFNCYTKIAAYTREHNYETCPHQ